MRTVKLTGPRFMANFIPGLLPQHGTYQQKASSRHKQGR